MLLAVYLMHRSRGYDPDSDLGQLSVTLLFLLPYVGIIFAIIAVRRVRPYDPLPGGSPAKMFVRSRPFETEENPPVPEPRQER